MRFCWVLLVALGLIGLTGCKPEADKIATADRLRTSVAAIAAAVPSRSLVDVVSQESPMAVPEFGLACRHRGLLTPADMACSNSSISEILKLDDPRADNSGDARIWREL